MARRNRRASVDDLAKMTADLTANVQVLVAAVDDLRCEVEWWSRNAVDARLASEARDEKPQGSFSPAPCFEHAADGWDRVAEELPTRPEAALRAPPAVPNNVPPTPCSSDSPTSASQRLTELERDLACGPKGKWPGDWDEEDEPPELPVGQIILVEEAIWSWALDLRPAHVVDMGCCCQEGIGAPYLLAWQNEHGCFLRELSDDESYALQEACLAAQRESADARKVTSDSQSQLGLW